VDDLMLAGLLFHVLFRIYAANYLVD